MDLKLVNQLTESRMYRSKQNIKNYSARQVCDHAFMDMIAIWILYNEFEFANTAIYYANKTAAYGGFKNFRQSSTDLYLSLHIISEKRTDLLDSAADETLLERVNLNEREIIRYLRLATQNNLRDSAARQTLQRMEHSLRIENSNYRSLRRLAQNWPRLTTTQKRTVLTRMVFFYKNNARHSEIYQSIKALAVSKGLVDKRAHDPEKNRLKTAAAATAAAVAGGVGGFYIGKGLV